MLHRGRARRCVCVRVARPASSRRVPAINIGGGNVRIWRDLRRKRGGHRGSSGVAWRAAGGDDDQSRRRGGAWPCVMRGGAGSTGSRPVAGKNWLCRENSMATGGGSALPARRRHVVAVCARISMRHRRCSIHANAR